MAEVEMDAEMQAFANDVLPSPCRYLASHKKGVSIMLDDPITRTPDEDTVIGFVTRNPTRPHQLVAWVTRSPTRPCRVYDIIFVAACAMMTGATGRFGIIFCFQATGLQAGSFFKDCQCLMLPATTPMC